MATSFLERFYDLVDDNLGSTHTSKRLTKAKKYRDLTTVMQQVFERLLGMTGQESVLGRAESDITITGTTAFYRLPGNFRSFVSLERRSSGDRNLILDSLMSIPENDTVGPGVVILSAQRGMLIRPAPDVDADQTWTLTYHKGPVKLHYGTAAAVGTSSLTATASVATDAGELIKEDDYYNNSILHVYAQGTASADLVDKYGVISDYVASTRVFTMREAWSSALSGTVLYEIMPVLPEPYYDIFAVDVALMNLSRRGQQGRIRSHLLTIRQELWNMCMSWVMSNVTDRAPARTSIIYGRRETDPYDTAFDVW